MKVVLLFLKINGDTIIFEYYYLTFTEFVSKIFPGCDNTYAEKETKCYEKCEKGAGVIVDRLPDVRNERK